MEQRKNEEWTLVFPFSEETLLILHVTLYLLGNMISQYSIFDIEIKIDKEVDSQSRHSKPKVKKRQQYAEEASFHFRFTLSFLLLLAIY